VEIVMSVDNTASRRAAEKAGARLEGMLHNRIYLHGIAHDAFMFSLVPADLLPHPP
jgi:RimJ/RimL family protein N-acetyltransferase